MKETIENNILLAEFLGSELEETVRGEKVYCLVFPNENDISGFRKEFFAPNELKFHNNWEWIHTVLIEISDKTGYELVMYYGTSYFNMFGENPLNEEFGGYEEITNIYNACIQFVKWYNNLNKKTHE